jgi:hypothetical protein
VLPDGLIVDVDTEIGAGVTALRWRALAWTPAASPLRAAWASSTPCGRSA